MHSLIFIKINCKDFSLKEFSRLYILSNLPVEITEML